MCPNFPKLHKGRLIAPLFASYHKKRELFMRTISPIMAGDRLGMLQVIEKVGRSQWECLCDCGEQAILTTTQLRANRKSCGCQAKLKKDMVGVRKGKLVAIAAAPSKSGQRFWLCRCDCGAEILVSTQELGPSSDRCSCGCVQKAIRQNAKKWKPDPRRKVNGRQETVVKTPCTKSGAGGGVLDDTWKSPAQDGHQ